MKKHVKKFKQSNKMSMLGMLLILVISIFLAVTLPGSKASVGSAVFSVEPTVATVTLNNTIELSLYVTVPTSTTLLTTNQTLNFPANLQFQSFSNAGTPFNISTTTGSPSVGATSVQIITSYFPPTTGNGRQYIGKVIVKGMSLGSGTVTVTNAAANDQNETAFSPVTVQNSTVSIDPPAAPDLVVLAINSTPNAPSPGQATTFSASVKNQGTAATAAGVAHVVTFQVGANTYTGNTYTSSIAAGATVTISVNAGQTWPAPVGLNQVVTATIDPTSTIAESNETNNTLTRSYNVVDTAAPTANPIFPGHTAVAADETLNTTTGVIVVRDLRQAVIKPQLTDNVGISTVTYTVNGAAVSLDGSGNYTFANNNADYAFRIVARDAANNLLDRTVTVKVRHPDIVRANPIIGYSDFTTFMTQWNTNNTQSDLDVSGTVDYYDFVKLMAAWNE